MSLIVHQFACLSDNYGYLVHDPASKETVAIDTPDASVYLAEAAARGWRITQIWNTHWHPDHAGGNAAIKAATGCRITAPAGDAARIEGIDRAVAGGHQVMLGDWVADAGAGYDGGALVFLVGLLVVAALYFFTSVSRTALFWSAFILTRPLGATVGDFLDKPVINGGLALSRLYASLLLAGVMIVLILVYPQRAGRHPG